MNNKINYKLFNILILLSIITLILYLFNSYSTSFELFKRIVNPIILSFFLSYSFYPIIKIINKKISYNFSCLIFLISFSLLFFISFYFLFNTLKDEYTEGISSIHKFLDILSSFNFDITSFKKYLFSFNLISNSYSYLSFIVLVIVLIIYFTFNMEKIRSYLLKYELIKKIDFDLFSYYKGFYIVILLESIEHLFLYFIIGHPYFLLLGMLSIITSLIPVLGVIILNLFALISAYFISDSLFIMTSIILLITPIINNYFIEPKIYNKTLNLSFISIILSFFIFGNIFDFIGVILSIPFYIIIKNIYLFKKN